MSPTLPIAYELIALDRTDAAVEEARRRARAGAEEGTLVWAHSQSAGTERAHRHRGNLHAALILRPEQPPETALQLHFAALLALNQALAEVAPPLADLRFQWPDAVLYNESVVGGCHPSWADLETPQLDWLVIELEVFIKHHPPTPALEYTSLYAEGRTEVTAEEILTAFARHFLVWINRWAEEGFAPVRKSWLQRLEGLGQPLKLTLNGKCLAPTFKNLDEDGRLVIELADGRRRKISATEYLHTGR